MPNEFDRAAMAKRRGELAAKETDTARRQKMVNYQGDQEAQAYRGKQSQGSADAKVSSQTMRDEDRMALDPDTRAALGKNVLDSYKKGTNYVPQTGNYKLHEGEAVVPKKDNPAAGFSRAQMAEDTERDMTGRPQRYGAAMQDDDSDSAPDSSDQPQPEAEGQDDGKDQRIADLESRVMELENKLKGSEKPKAPPQVSGDSDDDEYMGNC